MLEVCKCGLNACMTNGEQLREQDCIKYLVSHVAADGGCERDGTPNE